MKKRFASFFLLFVFELYLLGLFIHFKILQIQIKSEITQLIKINKLLFSTIECFKYYDIKDHIYWYEENKEFSYNKKMYDVLYLKKDLKNQLLLYVIQDTKEDNLIYNFIQKNKKDPLTWLKNFALNLQFILNNTSIKIFKPNYFEYIAFPFILYNKSFICKLDHPPKVII